MEKIEKIIKNDFDKRSLLNLITSLDIKEPKKVIIEEVKTNRTNAQNRLLWLWNGEFQRFMSEHYGQIASADEWHEILVEKLCPVQVTDVKLPDGESYKVGRARTSKFKTQQMTEYLEKLDAYCAGLGLLLPHPQDLMMAIYGRRVA